MSRGAYIYHPSHSYLGEHEIIIRNIPNLFVSVTHVLARPSYWRQFRKYEMCVTKGATAISEMRNSVGRGVFLYICSRWYHSNFIIVSRPVHYDISDQGSWIIDNIFSRLKVTHFSLQIDYDMYLILAKQSPRKDGLGGFWWADLTSQ